MVIDLKNAIVAIQDKIATSAGAASAEELAYLGTAIDRIGGRATVYDVVETGEVVKNEIVSLGDTIKSEITLDVTTKVTTATATVDNILANMVNSASATEATTIQSILDTKDSAELAMDNTKSITIQNILDTKDSAEMAIDNKKETTVASVNVTLDSVIDTIDNAVDVATSDINSKVLELQTAASELSSAASLANTQAVNSSLFTMLALSTLQ